VPKLLIYPPSVCTAERQEHFAVFKEIFVNCVSAGMADGSVGSDDLYLAVKA